MEKYSSIKSILVFLLTLKLNMLPVFSQQVYFIDGYHGGVYGHYPKQYTKFITETLDKNPDWKINLEIEPETWDTVKLHEPDNYNAFKKYFADQSITGRLEYVNPSYGQGYLYNINGESIIRQFYYGIKKMKEHFPTALFTSYSSEEPCFTSALPQILTSFGFKYASLKNPNTCWGGYTRAFGGELVNWVGPDGTKLITVPRYEIEALQPRSTWQTIASDNSSTYLDAAFKYGIKNPVGMCLQDAGWKNGPWLGKKITPYPTTYITWREYIQNASIKKPTQDWKLSQEDVQVSLVWGAQVVQKIAKEIRVSENKIGNAEKLSVLAKLYKGKAYPATEFDEAWRGILLSQHHDCWIVPYNGKKGNTWIDKVAVWTNTADSISNGAIHQAALSLSGEKGKSGNHFVRVFNGSGNERNDFVKIALPANMNALSVTVVDGNNNELQSQMINSDKEILFKPTVAGVGYNTYRLKNKRATIFNGNKISKQENGMYTIESDLYRIVIDPAKGGVIKSLIAKSLDGKELVDSKNTKSFNELSGYFFKDSNYFSSTQQPATIDILEDGALCSKIAIKGSVNQQPFTQTITVLQGQPLIDMKVAIDWNGNPGIGNGYMQKQGYKNEDYRKAFYDDSDKLQTMFPLNLADQKVYKNAPFDVTESKLDNTFFQTWDSIKNNIILNWVDVTDGDGKYGVALFSDHTTSYAHGKNFPLGLTTQYSGVGLWGRNYSITGPTEINYAIVPHKGKWNSAGVWTTNVAWNNPMTATVFQSILKPADYKRSLISAGGKGMEITAITMEGNDMLVRLFNGEAESETQTISFDGSADSIDLVELNGDQKQHLATTKGKLKRTVVAFNIPKFGIRTIRLKNFKTSNQ